MTSGAEPRANMPIKLCLTGDSGTGKTQATVSLILAGYKVRTIDVDNGIDIVLSCLHDPQSPYYELAQKIDLETAFRYETVNHKMITLDDGRRIRIQPQAATVWPKIDNLVHEWKESCGYKLGPITSWDKDCVLVLDSGTFAGTAAFYYSQHLNSRLGADPAGNDWRRDIGAAQGKFETLLQLLYSDAVKCNVIVITHINYLNESTVEIAGQRTKQVNSNASDIFGVSRAYPSSIGRALDPKIGRYFNNVLEVKLEGKYRRIYTTPQGAVNVKTSNPFALKETYDTSTGLAEIFATLRNEEPPRELLNALKKKPVQIAAPKPVTTNPF